MTRKREFPDLNFISYEIDGTELDVLLDSGLIDQMQEAHVSEPSLEMSIPFIKADLVHDLGYIGQGYSVAILDTGVDTDHPFLAGRIVEEACFSSTSASGKSTCPNDSIEQIGQGAGVDCWDKFYYLGCDHGTHVAGIAAGANSIYSANGVAKGANIVAIQVFTYLYNNHPDCKGAPTCLRVYDDDLIAALVWIRDKAPTRNIASVNMSIGGDLYTTYCDKTYLSGVIGSLRNKGIATVISAGNNGNHSAVSYPGCISSAITVGAIGRHTDVLAGYTNSASMVDIFAPGTSIISSTPYSNGYVAKSGTSMAAPHVAGAFAVMRSINPYSDVTSIEATLENNGVSIFDPTNGLTFPRLDLYAAAMNFGGGPKGVLYQSSYSVSLGEQAELVANVPNDPNIEPLTYTWSFGDGNSGYEVSDPSIHHTYQDKGIYQLDLTVTGTNYLESDTAKVTVYDPTEVVMIVIKTLLQ